MSVLPGQYHIAGNFYWKFLLDNIFALEMFANLIFAKREFLCVL